MLPGTLQKSEQMRQLGLPHPPSRGCLLPDPPHTARMLHFHVISQGKLLSFWAAVRRGSNNSDPSPSGFQLAQGTVTVHSSDSKCIALGWCSTFVHKPRSSSCRGWVQG